MSTPAWTDYFWDFDGTLYDTYPALTQCALYALADLGAYPKPAEVWALLKQSVYQMAYFYAQRYHLELRKLRERLDHYHQQMTKFTPYAGAAETLRGIVARGGRNFLYTHRDESALQCLQSDGLAAYFTDHIIRTDGFPDKPAPDALLHLLEKHGIAKQSAVMVGDRQIDLDAGHNADIAAVLFDPDGFYPTATPDLRIVRLTDLL